MTYFYSVVINYDGDEIELCRRVLNIKDHHKFTIKVHPILLVSTDRYYVAIKSPFDKSIPEELTFYNNKQPCFSLIRDNRGVYCYNSIVSGSNSRLYEIAMKRKTHKRTTSF